ncbi:MAG TPA: YtxH domain-containing protein [Gemmatimonadales bacterium]|nr:YtxH domain-containing protein [Gemmatimonadales bacterium]
MVTQQDRISDPNDLWSERPEGRGSRGGGALLMAALLGVGIGLLAAPQPGTRTRKLLLQRLAALGEDVGEGLEDVQEVSSKARKRVKQRLAKLRSEAEDVEAPERWSRARRSSRDDEMSEEDEGSGPFGKLFMLAAGLAATYFMTSERTAPARSRVQETASDVGRRATDQWDRFQRGGIRGWREGNESRSETRATSNPSDEAPQGS